LKLANTLARHGLPLVAFVVVGYAALGRFVENKVEAVDATRRGGSARALELEMAHRVVAGRLRVGEDYSVKPVPRPREE